MKKLLKKTINILFWKAKPSILSLVLLIILFTFYLLFFGKSEELN